VCSGGQGTGRRSVDQAHTVPLLPTVTTNDHGRELIIIKVKKTNMRE